MSRGGPNDTRILIADDVALMRDLLRSVLRNLDHQNIIEAADGEQALAYFQRRERPEVAFLDIKMPKMDGLTLLKEIRRDYPQTFIVIVSAEGTIDNLRQAIADGADAFVVKPYQGIKIQEALTKYYSRSRGAGG